MLEAIARDMPGILARPGVSTRTEAAATTARRLHVPGGQ